MFLAILLFKLLEVKVVGDRSGGGYTEENLQFLLSKNEPDLGAQHAENTIEWLSDQSWREVLCLAKLDGFEKFPADLEESSSRFREWFNQMTPEQEKLPLEWRELDKTPFKKLLVIKCLRPDRLSVAISALARSMLGSAFTECDTSSNSSQILASAYEQGDSGTPIFFILSPGSDIVRDVDLLVSC